VRGDPKHRTRFLLSFLILGCHVQVVSASDEVRGLLLSALGAMAAPDRSGAPDLRYRIHDAAEGAGFVLGRDGCPDREADDLDDLLFQFEKDVVLELQRRRSDLFFLHSAVLEWRGKAVLLAADSGSGKSTTAWGLLHHGFRYLSDELAPIDPYAMVVWPYPHALCLKERPAAPYPLPRETLDLGRTLHVPPSALPSPAPIADPVPLGALFFVRHRPELESPKLRRMDPAEAGVRLYVVALNALAHPNRGLDAALRIAAGIPCFEVWTTGLPASCVTIGAAAAEALGEPGESHRSRP